MLNGDLNLKYLRLVLKVDGCDSHDDREKRAGTAAERFVQIGKMLPHTDVLGLWYAEALHGVRRAEVFSSDTVDVTANDCGWIFEKCAKVAQYENVGREKKEETEKTVYFLQYVTDYDVQKNLDNEYDYIDDSDFAVQPKQSYQDVFKELLRIGADIQIEVGSQKGENNSVAIALPGLICFVKSDFIAVYPLIFVVPIQWTACACLRYSAAKKNENLNQPQG